MYAGRSIYKPGLTHKSLRIFQSILNLTKSTFFDNRAANGAGLTDDSQAGLTNSVPDN